MKRVALFALPVLGTLIVLGLGIFLMRTQGPAIKVRIEKLNHAVGEAVEEFTEELGEEKPE